MANVSSTSTNPTYEVRSISLPATPHPSIDCIKNELNLVQTWMISSSCKPSIEAIYDGLLKLSRLYDCMNELINALRLTQKKKHVEDVMDTLVGFLDVCSITRDIMSRYKEHVKDVQSALRRRKSDSCIRTSIAGYNCFRKTVKRDVKTWIATLHRSTVPKSQDHGRDQLVEDEEVMKVLMEATVSVFESLLMPFVHPSSQTPDGSNSKWFLVVSKLIQRTKVGCEEGRCLQTNNIEGLDVVLSSRCIKEDEFSSCWNDACIWEAMEGQIGRIEDGLDVIFRSMIRARASLLNIVSEY